MKLLTIGGVDMPAPTKYDVDLSDVDAADSGRGETGHMSRTRVRQDVSSIALGWTNLTNAELATVVNAIAPDAFSVRFFYGVNRTAQMYAGNRKLSLQSDCKDGEERWNLNCSLVEY